MYIGYENSFIKNYKKLPKKVQKQAKIRIALFKANQFHPLLQNHALKEKWFTYRSINISGDCCAIYKELQPQVFSFVAIDTHSQLYS